MGSSVLAAPLDRPWADPPLTIELPPDPRYLRELTYRAYYSDELDVTYYLVESGASGLALQIRPLADADVLQTPTGELIAREGALTLRFTDLASNRYGTMTVNAGRVQNLAFRRR